jgi:predicted transcriptional regulator
MPSGRIPKAVDTELMLSLISDGMSRKDIAAVLGVTPPTLDARVEELRKEEKSLLAYDKSKYLDLISVQERLIAGITDEKISEAPLGQIAQAYGVFDKAKQLDQGRPTEIHGLMGYLLHLEKEDIDNREKSIFDISAPSDG